VKDWTRDDLRKLSRDLDAKVRGDDIAWKTAINIWGTATKICSDASESKLDAIRCRPDDPSDKVRGPDEGDEVGLQFLYPSEFVKVVTCPEVPLKWRRLIALAVYSYARDGELRALEPRDVHEEHGRLNIDKAYDNRSGELGSPKGGTGRRVPMEAPLGPLVRALRGQYPSHRDMARGLRRWLKRAGVDRHELHHTTPTSRPIRFHDLRATGVTWLAIRNDPPLEIQRRAGHQNFETTQKYIRLADALRAGFGTVFPSLPPELLSESTSGVLITSSDQELVTAGILSRFSGADGTRTRGLRRDRPAL
jgi:integrase